MLQTLFLFVDLQWIVLYWSGKSITNNNKYNEYNCNPAAIKFQYIFVWLLFTVYITVIPLISIKYRNLYIFGKNIIFMNYQIRCIWYIGSSIVSINESLCAEFVGINLRFMDFMWICNTLKCFQITWKLKFDIWVSGVIWLISKINII